MSKWFTGLTEPLGTNICIRSDGSQRLSMDMFSHSWLISCLFLFLFLRTVRARRASRCGASPQSEVTMAVDHPNTRDSWNSAILGLDPKRAARLTGRMALSESKFVLMTDKGRFTQIDRTQGRLLTSARCTAPGRLVIEGTIPQAGGQPGVYRLEAMFTEAEAWAVALQPFVDPDAPKFGVMPPNLAGPKTT